MKSKHKYEDKEFHFAVNHDTESMKLKQIFDSPDKIELLIKDIGCDYRLKEPIAIQIIQQEDERLRFMAAIPEIRAYTGCNYLDEVMAGLKHILRETYDDLNSGTELDQELKSWKIWINQKIEKE